MRLNKSVEHLALLILRIYVGGGVGTVLGGIGVSFVFALVSLFSFPAYVGISSVSSFLRILIGSTIFIGGISGRAGCILGGIVGAIILRDDQVRDFIEREREESVWVWLFYGPMSIVSLEFLLAFIFNSAHEVLVGGGDPINTRCFALMLNAIAVYGISIISQCRRCAFFFAISSTTVWLLSTV